MSVEESVAATSGRRHGDSRGVSTADFSGAETCSTELARLPFIETPFRISRRRNVPT
jgi:hypothetical protein